jgi:hypothetical protein
MPWNLQINFGRSVILLKNVGITVSYCSGTEEAFLNIRLAFIHKEVHSALMGFFESGYGSGYTISSESG